MSKAGKFEDLDASKADSKNADETGAKLLADSQPMQPAKSAEKNADAGAPKLENIDPLEKAQVGDKNSPEKVVTDLQKNIAPKVESLVAAGELKKDTVDQWKNQFKYIPDSVWKSMEKAN